MGRLSKTQPEAIIQRHIVQYLWMQKEYFGFTVKNGGTFDPRIGQYRANSGAGYRRGVSDLVGAWNGQLFCIEVKTATGRLSEHQEKFRQDVIAAGGLHLVARSVDDIVNWVAAMRLVAARETL